MKKFLVLLILLFPLSVFGLDLHSEKYVIYNLDDDEIILEKGISDDVMIASLTKILSAMVIIEGCDNLDKKVVYTREMKNSIPLHAYVIHLKEGVEYTYSDLLYATILPSAADAVTALAINYSSSVSDFVSEMNKKAKEIGLQHSNFTNPIGMDDSNNHSTLEDVLILLRYALKNDTFKKIYMTKEYTLSDGKVIYSSINMYSEKLNIDTSRILGAKTGATGGAGYALSQIFESGGHHLLSISVLAPQTKDSYHIIDGLNIIHYMDDNYSDKTLLKKNILLRTIPVYHSNIKEYKLYSDKELIKYLNNDYKVEDFHIKFNLPKYLDYHSKNKIGEVYYYYQEQLLYTQNIILDKKIRPSLFEYIKKYIIIVPIIILICFCIRKTKKV